MPHRVLTIMSAKHGLIGYLHTSLRTEDVMRVLARGLQVTEGQCNCNYGMDSPPVNLAESR